MLEIDFTYHPCRFLNAGTTSRGTLWEKPSWILKISNNETQQIGYGEVSLIPKLSPEKAEEIPALLNWLKQHINEPREYLFEFLNNCPAVLFGLESAFTQLDLGIDTQTWFSSPWLKGNEAIEINGLVWMNDFPTMLKAAEEKIADGFRCIKIKIGAIHLEDELKLVAHIRNLNPDIEIRLDANGAFQPDEVLNVLEAFAAFQIHSIEQPIAIGQHKEMQKLARISPIPIALDEELIGIYDPLEKNELLRFIKPQYIILKPSLMGGISGSDNWISNAESLGISWWGTSALESNLGLTVIAQWLATKELNMPQGLGTGGLFSNNFPSCLELKGPKLFFNPIKKLRLPL
ncbi:MAG: o-succinylbenzoate synthase [Luteibaculum sp.]